MSARAIACARASACERGALVWATRRDLVDIAGRSSKVQRRTAGREAGHSSKDKQHSRRVDHPGLQHYPLPHVATEQASNILG